MNLTVDARRSRTWPYARPAASSGPGRAVSVKRADPLVAIP